MRRRRWSRSSPRGSRGPSLSLAVHIRDTNRLIGTCALSQLDSDNGSALSTTSRLAKRTAWGRGYTHGATRLMLDHAFGTLNLHRIGLSVFSFNERQCRRLDRAEFVVEGRAREGNLARTCNGGTRYR